MARHSKTGERLSQFTERILHYQESQRHTMKKSYLIMFLLCVVSKSTLGFEKIELGHTCSYFGESMPKAVYTFASDQHAESVVNQIMDITGLPKNFVIKSAGVPNAAAVVVENQRYILYNESFMYEIKKRIGNKWAAHSIVAHEIGHHLSGHTLDDIGSRPSLELEADQFSGFILQKLGASLGDAQSVISKIASVSPSATHPAKHDRLAAISSGWMNSCKKDPTCSGAEVIRNNSGAQGEIATSKPFNAKSLALRFNTLIAESQKIKRAAITEETKNQILLVIDDVRAANSISDKKAYYEHANNAISRIDSYLEQKRKEENIEAQFLAAGKPIQKKLNSLNCGAGPVDGDIGPMTSQALLRWDNVNNADNASLDEIKRLGDEMYELAEASAKTSDPDEYHKLYIDMYLTGIRKYSVMLDALNRYSRNYCR